MRKLSLEDIAKGEYSGHELKQVYVVQDKATWKKLWKITYAPEPKKPRLPSIDFSSFMVVAAFMGKKTCEGHSISIDEAIEKDEFFVVIVRENSQPSLHTVDTA